MKHLKQPVPGTLMRLKMSFHHMFSEQGDAFGLGGHDIFITNDMTFLVLFATPLNNDHTDEIIDYKLQVLTRFGVYWTWCRDSEDVT